MSVSESVDSPSRERTECVLEVTDLTLVTDGTDGLPVILVDRVSFSVYRGESLCLVGESGSGKSLTMLAVMGLLPPGVRQSGGRILLNGREIQALNDDQLRTIRGREMTMIFQDPMTSLNPLRRVGRQIDDAIKVHQPHWGVRERAARVQELLRAVGVPQPNERARTFPHQWSGGMRQRAMIAMAMAHDPDLLIADEPTTALDVTIQAQVMDVLDAARERTNSAMILITHDLGLVAGVADRVAVMYSGRIVELGSVFDIFSRPSHHYTAALLGSIMTGESGTEPESKRARGIGGSPPSPADRPTGCSFAPRCPVRTEEAGCDSTVPEQRGVNDSQQVACFLPRTGPAPMARIPAQLSERSRS